MRGSPWIIQVGPKFNNKCPCKKKVEGDVKPAEEKTQVHRGEGNVKMVATTGVTRAQLRNAKESPRPPEAIDRRDEVGLSPGSRQRHPANTLISDSWLPELGKNKFLLF